MALPVRQVAIQRSDSLRGVFIAQALMYKRELFVWLDETGGDNRNCIRLCIERRNTEVSQDVGEGTEILCDCCHLHGRISCT